MSPTNRLATLLRTLLAATGLPALILFSPAPALALTIEPSTWNIIGLDSNSPATGPYRFPVGAKLCGGTPGANTTATLTWDSANAYIDLRAGSKGAPGDPITITYGSNGCADAFFEVEVTQTSAAYDTTRRYHITAGGLSTPTPRELKVERLVSQSRNAISNMEFGTSLASLTSVPNGGSMDLVIGNTYYIRMSGYTATQGYEQLESFVNFPNTIFQILSVSSTYSADTSAIVSSPNDKLYSDACGWDNDPNSPSYLSCYSDGKAGGIVAVTYQVRIVATTASRESLSSLIHDFSGSSFHYNADYSTSARFANIINPASVTISKNFSPNPTNAGGVSVLTFTINNPNDGTVTGVNFTDPLPTDLLVANPPNASYSNCGSPTFSPVAGNTSLSFSNGTLTAGSRCTVQVNVSPASVKSYTNTTNHLYLGTVDTGNYATSSLTANNAPPPPVPVCGQILAKWSVPTTPASTNPPDTTGGVPTTKAGNVATATASALSASNTGITSKSGEGVGDNSAWSVYGFKTAGLQQIDFVVDTSKYNSVFMGFDMANPSPTNGPTQVVISYSTGGSFTPFYTINNPVKAFTAYSIDFSSMTSTTGTTTFRIIASGALTDSASGNLLLDNITFTGCNTPVLPTISKSFATNPVAVGGTSNLNFLLTNPNSYLVSYTNVSFTDTLPAGLTVATGSSAQCGGTLTTTAPSTISFSGGTLAAGASCTVTATVTATTAGPHDNVSGYVSGQYSGNTYTNGTTLATASLLALSAPTIAKAFAPDPIFINGTSTLTFTLSNPNVGNALSGVTFTDTFPVAPGAMVLVNTTTTNTCGGVLTDDTGGVLNNGDSGIRLTGGTITAGGTCTVTVNVTAPTAGTYTNTSGNVSHTLSGTWSGGTASDTLTVEAPNPAIALLKQVAPASTGPWSSYLAVTAGGSVYYRFTVENLGDVPLSPFSVSDPGLPAPLTLASCTWKDGDGNTLSAPLTLPVADADNGHIATCILGPATATTGTHPNTATASGSFGATTVTDTSTATYATSTLTLAKNADKSFYLAADETINYSYVISNTGAAVLTGPLTVAMTDNLISNVTCPAITTVGDLDIDFDPGESINCTAAYTVSASDVSDKQIVNLARASVSGVNIGTVYTPQVTRNVPLGPDLSVAKTNDTLDNTYIGDPFTWTLTITNSASAGMAATFANGWELLTDNLPDTSVSYALPTVSYTGGTTGTVSCGIASNVLICTASGAVSIPPGGTVKVAVAATPTAAGSLVNPKPGAGNICRVDPDTHVVEISDSNNDCSNTVNVATPDIALIKSATPLYFVAQGETITYTYKVKNNGAVALAGPVSVTDNKATVTCPPTPILNAGAEVTCTATYTVTAGDITAREVTNTATATVGTKSSPTVSLTVPLGPDLSVVKTHPAGIPIPGVPFNWTLTVTNAATAGYPANYTDTQLLLQDDLPSSGATYNLPATAATAIGATTGTINCTVAANTLTCVASGNVSIPPGSGFSIAVPVTATSGGTLTNPRGGGICQVDPATPPATGLVIETDETNNNCADSVLVGMPSITMLKTVAPYWDPVNGSTNPKMIPGALAVYMLLVTNTGYGPADAGTVNIIDPLPANTEMFVDDFDGAGPVVGPVQFIDGAATAATAPSGLSYPPADVATKLSFSNNGGASYGYTPTPDAGTGCDPQVTHFKISFNKPADIFAGSNGTNHPTFTLMFRARIK